MRTRPWTMLLMMMAGWINSHQQDVIEFLREENKILREKLGTKRIILNDNQRMRLARLGKRIGRKVLSEACCAFSPDTVVLLNNSYFFTAQGLTAYCLPIYMINSNRSSYCHI